MFSGTYPLLMAEYNAWMNEKVYAACASLSDDARKQDRGAFFKSIHLTLNHVLWGDRAWLGRFKGKNYGASPIGEELFVDFVELRAARQDFDAELLTWARGVTEEWLAAPLTSQPRWVFVVQMFNHQTHHRGQVHTLLTQVGVDVGATDVHRMPVLHREEPG